MTREGSVTSHIRILLYSVSGFGSASLHSWPGRCKAGGTAEVMRTMGEVCRASSSGRFLFILYLLLLATLHFDSCQAVSRAAQRPAVHTGHDFHQYHTLQCKEIPSDVDVGVDSSASQWDPDVQPWRESKGAGYGGEETAQAEESKSRLAFIAVVAIAVLVSVLLLVALGYLLKLKWQKRKQEHLLPVVNNALKEDTATREGDYNLEKEQKLTEIALEIEELIKEGKLIQ